MSRPPDSPRPPEVLPPAHPACLPLPPSSADVLPPPDSPCPPEMDSDEDESSDSKEVAESDDDSDFGMAGIACNTTPATNFFKSYSSDNETPRICFMANASKEKVSSKHHKVYTSEQFSSNEDDHAKLIKIAKKQEKSLEKMEKNLRKSKGLLVEEAEKNQSLTEEHCSLTPQMEELINRHDFLSADYERLTYD